MPHLRELVKLHADKPFAIIGVNTGDSPEDFRQGVEAHGVSWITAYQGPKPAIANLYRVSGYPLTPLAFVALMLWMIGHAITEAPAVALAGLATLAVAGGLYVWLGRPAAGE